MGQTTGVILALHAPVTNDWFLLDSQAEIRPIEDGPFIFDTFTLAETNQVNVFEETGLPITEAHAGLCSRID